MPAVLYTPTDERVQELLNQVAESEPSRSPSPVEGSLNIENLNVLSNLNQQYKPYSSRTPSRTCIAAFNIEEENWDSEDSDSDSDSDSTGLEEIIASAAEICAFDSRMINIADVDAMDMEGI